VDNDPDPEIDFASPPPGVDPSDPPLLTILQDQLGLKLKSVRAPAGVVVTDHAEPTIDEAAR
jgi:uncharacterized protein (TIGR03435 family)